MGRRLKRTRPSLNPPGKRYDATAYKPNIDWRLPRMRKCAAPGCPNEFVIESPRGNAKTCSPECSEKFEIAWRKEYYRTVICEPNRNKVNARQLAAYHRRYRPVMKRCVAPTAGRSFPLSARLSPAHLSAA